MNLELDAGRLRPTIDPATLGVESTREVTRLEGIIGQKRAVDALCFGLRIRGSGYNVYVSGPPGIGKMTSVKSFLDRFAAERPAPPDWCYVNNFDNDYEPRTLKLPAGQGGELKKDIERMVERVRVDLPALFESEAYAARREKSMAELVRERERISKEVEEKAAERGFAIQATPMGIMIIPVKEGRPLLDEEFQALSGDEQKKLREAQEALQAEMKEARQKMRVIERQEAEKGREVDRQVALEAVGELFEELKEKYADSGDVVRHLQSIQEDILENIGTFRMNVPPEAPEGNPMVLARRQRLQAVQEQVLKRYEVNVVVDNGRQSGAPVVLELNPTYVNLIGRIENEMRLGALSTDFTLIRAGALLQANGGFLVLPAEDLLKSPFSWEALKRSLRSGEIRIEDVGQQLGFMTVKSLRPQAIPLNVKVVLIGRPLLYHLLYAYDSEFPELFKVKADFDTRMDKHEQDIRNYLGFIATFREKEGLRHLDASALAAMLEHGSRLGGHQEKLTTNFGSVADLLREADFWAGQEETEMIAARHIRKALDEKVFRSNLIQERIREMIVQGQIRIDLDEPVLGQVNGLSVISLGDYVFGRPSRITATVGPGREGVIDLERQVNLGGPLHSKGVLILGGFLVERFAHERPLTLAARLVFEQSYESVDGDSASSAELYAVLSALSGLPLKQNMAVTGSVDQKGVVQAIGGVNEKIEGFFEVCRAMGLNGRQGVVIPESNVQNLVLKDEVVAAVRDGRFRIWAVATIDQGIELLTGRPAGKRQAGGSYPADTVYGLAMRRLSEYSRNMKDLTRDGENPA